ESKTKTTIRLLTFNVNSVSTVLQYYPMTRIPSSMRNLNTLFNWLEADIICLQELKISNPIISSQHGILSDYKCFLTLPKLKKNYSGVGIYVKKSLPIKVVKAEEGITGFLPVNNTSINNYKIIENSYRTSDSLSIGGYENLDIIFDNDIERALALDSQGRCIITEFNNGLIVIGCYIPANSIFSEEGLLFKMQYFKLIFQRIDNFQKAGKTVILMGDLNVCKDIIDREESLQVANKYFSNNTGNDIDPQLNYEFIKEKPERFFFNQQLMNSNFKIENNYKGSLLDSTRYIHPDRRKMYTCWNTLTNARSVNYGSRLDYILISKKHKNNILSSDILPEIQGSDHCPVFSDFLVSFENEILAEDKPLKFECKTFYKLINRDIMKMFGTK
ncbi:DNase I-like protein, partial [Hanseniaspora valbyensis NRRL Y-1626]